MEFNEVFDHIGHFGLYQCLLYIMLGLTSLSSSIQNININFVGAYQAHWCLVPRLEEFPHDVQKYVAIPNDGDEYDSCNVYVYPFENLTDEQIYNWNRTDLDGNPVAECSSWVYDQTEFVSTVNSEFDLVCGRSWLSQMASTIFMFGMFVGSITSGIVSDKIGRYKTCVIGISVNFVIGMVSPFVPGYPTFVVVRFLRSVTASWSYLAGFVIVMEVMGPAYRVSLGVLFQVFFSVGFMLVTGVSYAIRDFRWFQLALAVPLAALLLLALVLPESPRWLLARGRVDEAEAIVRKIAAVNGRTLPKEFELTPDANDKQDKTSANSSSSEDTERRGKFSDICKSTILRKEMCILYLNWFTTSLTYYGLSLNAGAFGDVFLNTFLSGVIEIPANLLCILCLEKGGRRYPNAASLLVGGAFCLACIPVVLVNPDLETALTVLSTLGKGAITFAFSSIYIYTAEMFHTPVRHLALGSASTFSRVGSMLSPYIGEPLADIWSPMPTLIFGVLSVGTGAVCFLLPETKGFPLPDTLEQAEDIGRGRRSSIDQGDNTSEKYASAAFTDASADLSNGAKFTRMSEKPSNVYDNNAFDSEPRRRFPDADPVDTFENITRL